MGIKVGDRVKIVDFSGSAVIEDGGIEHLSGGLADPVQHNKIHIVVFIGVGLPYKTYVSTDYSLNPQAILQEVGGNQVSFAPVKFLKVEPIYCSECGKQKN